LWSGVKLPVWLPTFLLPIICAADVQMAHARPFSTSTLQGLSNGIKKISRRGVLPSTVELWSCGSPWGLQIPTFGSVSLILTLASKCGCDTTLHNFNKGYGWSYSNLYSTITKQIIKCSIYIKKGNFLSFPLHHFFSNLHIKHQIEPNVHFMINYKNYFCFYFSC
jgi:hypothetical protein